MVERKHQRLLNVARAFLFHAHMHISFWGFAVLIFYYLINKIPVSRFADKTSLSFYLTILHCIHILDLLDACVMLLT